MYTSMMARSELTPALVDWGVWKAVTNTPCGGGHVETSGEAELAAQHTGTGFAGRGAKRRKKGETAVALAYNTVQRRSDRLRPQHQTGPCKCPAAAGTGKHGIVAVPCNPSTCLSWRTPASVHCMGSADGADTLTVRTNSQPNRGGSCGHHLQGVRQTKPSHRLLG